MRVFAALWLATFLIGATSGQASQDLPLFHTEATAKNWSRCVADLIDRTLANTSYRTLQQTGSLSWSNFTGAVWYRFTATDRVTGRSYSGGLYAEWDAPSCYFYDSRPGWKYPFFLLKDSEENTVLKAVRHANGVTSVKEIPYRS